MGLKDQDPEIRAAGEARWAALSGSTPPEHSIALTIIKGVREIQGIFAEKGHALASTQLHSDWVHFFCGRCDGQWHSFVHGVSHNVGFFQGLDRCKGAP